MEEKRKYKYLYNEKSKLVFVDDASKGNYKYDKDDVDYNYCYVKSYEREDGVKVRAHFSLKSNNPLFIQGGLNESIEHRNACRKIVYEKKYFDTIFDKTVFFDFVEEGKKIEHGMKPDLLCYNDNKLVLIIEIHYTNAKTLEDIEKLKNYNVPVVQIHIKNENECEHLILPTLLEVNRQKYNELHSEYKRVKREERRGLSRTDEEIIQETIERDTSSEWLEVEELEKKTKELQRRIEKSESEYTRLKNESSSTFRVARVKLNYIEQKIKKVNKSRINAKEYYRFYHERISNIREKIQSVNRKIQAIKPNSEKISIREIQKIEREIEKVKRLTYWQNSRSRQANTIIKRTRL